MKEFFQLMRRFVSPYKKYLGWAVLLNILSAVLNVFSYTLLIPILAILFQTEEAKVHEYMPWESVETLKEFALNNFNYYATQMIEVNGPSTTLLIKL